MVKVDARGDACPLPVVKAKKAIAELNGAGEVEILVDNEIAVQNLTKMAQQKGLVYSAEKLAEREYSVRFTVGETTPESEEKAEACAPDLADVPQYVLKFFVDNHFNLRALDDMLNVWIRPVPCSCEVSGDAE